MAPKRIFVDKRLSLAARGLAGTLALLCQDGDAIDTATLETPSTKNEISAAVAELSRAGYISEVDGINILHL